MDGTTEQDDFGDGEAIAVDSPAASSHNIEPEAEAPRYAIPSRNLAAVEMPANVQNIDRAVKTFGRVPTLQHVLDPNRNSLPIYLNPESPFCKPVMSHNASSHNVVLKVTVPMRTGRKRKRGSDGPWQGDIEVPDAGDELSETEKICSVARLDDPKVLRRKLQDNVDKYKVEAVGTIGHTHRFRGMADFYWDMSSSPFAQRYVEQVLPGNIEQLRQFKFIPGTDRPPNVDVLPPPIFTHMSLPFNYNYSQNPYVRETEDGDMVNLTAAKYVGYFIGAEDATPDGPQRPPDMTDIRNVEVLAELEEAFQDRPIWTRRALLNHLGGKLRNWNELKKFLNYVAYQFKGGPWRDAVVFYGVDPRTDPKYRIYQTLMFKLPKQKRARDGQSWKSLRKTQMGPLKEYSEELAQSHIFDGEEYHVEGKIWQICDITDLLLKELIENAAVRPSWDVSSGWYHGGLWAKIKAIMKTKLVALRFGRHLTRSDFEGTLQVGDQTPVRSATATFHLPLPSLDLTENELTSLRGKRPGKRRNAKQYSVRMREPAKSPGQVEESRTATPQAMADELEEDYESADEEGSRENPESESGEDDDIDDEAFIDPALKAAEDVEGRGGR